MVCAMKIRRTYQDFYIATERISNRRNLVNVLDEGMESNQDTVLQYIFDILGMKKNLKVIIYQYSPFSFLIPL
jgi:hypothetical protein